MKADQARALFLAHCEPGDLSHYGEKAAVAAIMAATEQWRHKLWMVACHATGGGIPEIEGVDGSVNDICVQITRARNIIYQAGKDAALTRTERAA